MAHHVEPMDIDSDFDNKENSLHHNNVLPFTEKGYEELDVSELNMKLRYSVTPASSPMSKSFTANCTERSLDSVGDSLNVTVNENFNLSHSLNSTLTKNDSIIKSLKALPLQTIPTEQFVDSNRNTSVLRSLDSAVTPDNGNITVTVSGPSDIDENLSLPSSSSSVLHTPEATTPTKDMPLKDGGSPIMRGLKSVLNMFRTSQSPIPPVDNEGIIKQEMLSPAEQPLSTQDKSTTVLASTPIASHRKKEMSPTKRSPPKDSSIVFNDDLEKELQWKDETTIIFSQERIPIHKLMLQQPQDTKNVLKDTTEALKQDIQELNTTVEYMDISYNDSFRDRTITEIKVDNVKTDGTFGGESDSEFVDCETTFTKNKSPPIEDIDKIPVSQPNQDFNLTYEPQSKNDSGSRLKQIILDSTQDILDATLSVRPEDLLPELSEQTKDMSELVLNETRTASEVVHQETASSQSTEPVFNQTVDISNPLQLEAKANESNDFNHTKTIDVTVGQTNQTYTAEKSLLNEEIKKENLDATKTIENILGVTQILENQHNIADSINTQIQNETVVLHDNTISDAVDTPMNVTKTLENVFDATQILENKYNTAENQNTQISNETVLLDGNTTSDAAAISLNVTKTLENILDATQTLGNQHITTENQNTDISNETVVLDGNTTSDVVAISLNVTKTLEHILDATQTLGNQHITTENQNTQISNETVVLDGNTTFDATGIAMNVTKTLENVLDGTQILESQHSIVENTQTSNETVVLDGNTTSDAADTTMNVTKTIENVLNSTLVLENQEGIAEQMNTQISNETVVLDGNITLDAAVSSMINVDTSKNNGFDSEKRTNDFIQTPALSNADSVLFDETVIKPLPIPDESNIDVDQDITMTELPVDIPLPDEDDLEKELNIPSDIPLEGGITSLPLDLVDDIKIPTQTIEIIQTEIEETKVNLTETLNNEAILPEVCATVTTPKLENDNVNNATFDNNFTETDITKQINIAKEMSEFCTKTEKINLLLEFASTSNIIKDDGMLVEKIVKSENQETNAKTEIINDVNIEKTVAPKEEVVLSHDAPIDNESICKLKPLPDIINQTIAVSNSENVVMSTNVPETVPPENKDSICEPISSEFVINNIEQQTTNIDDVGLEDPIIKTDNVIEENQSTTALNAIIPELSNVLIVPDMTEISLSDKVSDIVESKEIEVINKESNFSPAKDVPSSIEVPQTTECSYPKEAEEEIRVSENNSPFVSVIADTKPQGNMDVEHVEDPFATKTKVIITPPTSPPIRSKGYNFNFDDIDFDPFATKTNIRMSPPIDSPNKIPESNVQDKIFEKPVPKKDINRRKSQPERKKATVASKRKFNASFDGKINDKVTEKPIQKLETGLGDIQLNSPGTIALSPNNVTIEEKVDQKIDIAPEAIKEPVIEIQDKITKPIETSTDISDNSLECNMNEIKPTSSSSEQSAYYSACTTSSESSIPSKNVFNLPEIDDANFNPFATKSKMRQSPPPNLDTDNPFATKSKVMASPDSSIITVHKSEAKPTLSEDKIETELMEKDASGNLSNASKATDEKNATTKEINTEDEDTVEGPFLESEDLNTDEKMSDFDGENIDMLQFGDMPPKSSQENADNGEMFIDAEAFEFLLNQNKSNTVADSGKESLFLKFDPLFAKRMSAVTSDGVLASLAKLQKRQSTPTKGTRTSPKKMQSPVAGPSNLNVTQDVDMNISEEFNDDLNITVSKPMMVVPPAVNPVTPRNKSLTPNRSNRRSITFTSPAMAVIDRLLSLSGNNSLMHDTTVTQVSREQNEADIALSQLRELLAEKEINVYNLKCESNELKDRLNTLEGHVKSLEAESEDRLKKINQLNDTLIEKTKINKSMAAVVEEYERTIASLIAETAQDKKKHAEERIKLINERDEQTAHLASMEVSFSDLHSKYEKSKQIILNCKAHEDVYKKSIKEFEENLNKMHNNYELLKQHATSKLNHANQELEKINRSHEAEVLKLNAMIKRKELHITSLEESLAQKTKANDELTAICDELINKVG